MCTVSIEGGEDSNIEPEDFFRRIDALTEVKEYGSNADDYMGSRRIYMYVEDNPQMTSKVRKLILRDLEFKAFQENDSGKRERYHFLIKALNTQWEL